jgi:cysteine-rich repeat protein
VLAEGTYPLTNYVGAETCDSGDCKADRWLRVSVPKGEVLKVTLNSNDATGAARAILYEMNDGCASLSEETSVTVVAGSPAQLTYMYYYQARDYALALVDDSKTSGSDISFDITSVSRAPSVCGDGYRDDYINEDCDDGNTTPGDGCSDSCQREFN